MKKKFLFSKFNNSKGSSMILALAYILIVAVVASLILLSATVNSNAQNKSDTLQSRYNVADGALAIAQLSSTEADINREIEINSSGEIVDLKTSNGRVIWNSNSTGSIDAANIPDDFNSIIDYHLARGFYYLNLQEQGLNSEGITSSGKYVEVFYMVFDFEKANTPTPLKENILNLSCTLTMDPTTYNATITVAPINSDGPVLSQGVDVLYDHLSDSGTGTNLHTWLVTGFSNHEA